MPAPPPSPLTLDHLDRRAAGLPGCRRKGTAARPAWYVDDRLVMRLEDATTLRCALGRSQAHDPLPRHPPRHSPTQDAARPPEELRGPCG